MKTNTEHFSDNGRFFSALMMEFSGHDKAIVARAFSDSKPSRQLRTLGNNLYWLDGRFIHLIIYIFTIFIY